MKPIDIRLIQARRKKIDAEIDALQSAFEKKIVALKAEAKELDIAERVFSRLSQDGDSGDSTANGAWGEGKPEGLPPVSDMIREALAYAAIQNGVGLKPSGILGYVRGKWWPGAQSNDVGPIAWRMWQNDQIEKYQDGEYALLKADREAVLAQFEEDAAKMPPPGPIPQTG